MYASPHALSGASNAPGRKWICAGCSLPTWRNDPVDLDVLQTLQRRVALPPKVAPDVQLVLFSKSGFTSRVEAARTPYAQLLTLSDLFS